MTTLIAFVDQIAIGLYFLIGFGILLYLYRFLAYRSEYRASYFELERDLTRYKQANAITVILVLIEVAIIILGIQRVVVPTLRQDESLRNIQVAQQQDGVFATFTPAPPAGVAIDPAPPLSEDNFVGPRPTPTLTPTPVGTIRPAPDTQGCDSEQATLQIPANGMRVFQPIPVVGSAFTDNFAYAKIELRGPGTFDNYIVIEDKRQPVREIGEFSQFVPAPYEEGLYQFRLMVFDITDTLQAACMVNIYISEPFPTATPLSAET